MQTIQEIIHSVRTLAPTYSESSFRRDAARLGIRPVTKLRTVPRIYPPDTAARILNSRGLVPTFVLSDIRVKVNGNTQRAATLPPADTAAARIAKLPSMAELRTERKKARGAK